MKNKNNYTLIAYLLTSTLMALFCHEVLENYFSTNKHTAYGYAKDLTFILVSAAFLKYILIKKELRNTKVYNKLKNTNFEIKESNERYDIVSKATSDIIWDWKIPEDKISWNKGIENLFGYTQNQIGNSSKWWFDKIHPEDSVKMAIKLYSFIEQKTEKWQDEYRFRCADGSYRYVLDRGFILKNKNNKSVRMIGAIQDITKQKLEEQRLKLLETVITQAKDSIIITDADMHNNNLPKIVYVNPAFLKMSGYNSNEIIGKTPNIFIGPNSDLKELEKLSNAIKSKKDCQIETISYKKNGEEYWVGFSMLPVFNPEGDVSHWVSIQRDITITKKQEEEKEQLIQELTKNNKNLQQFSYITSHNLRAPLSNLTGLLNLIKEIPIEDPELKEILDGFNKSTYLLNETINDLIKAIVIKDNPSIAKENVSINDAFENTSKQINLLSEPNQPIIEFNLEKVNIIYTNKAYFESILLNLLTNSLKYKSENRNLKITIATELHHDKVYLHFEDNGIGIDLTRNKDKVFGLYQRFHDFPDSKGLGLYIVKSQIEAMGGQISIESKVNVGTKFTLTFKNK